MPNLVFVDRTITYFKYLGYRYSSDRESHIFNTQQLHSTVVPCKWSSRHHVLRDDRLCHFSLLLSCSRTRRTRCRVCHGSAITVTANCALRMTTSQLIVQPIDNTHSNPAVTSPWSLHGFSPRHQPCRLHYSLDSLAGILKLGFPSASLTIVAHGRLAGKMPDYSWRSLAMHFTSWQTSGDASLRSLLVAIAVSFRASCSR